MKWYGFCILFFVVSMFDSLLYKVRLDYSSETSIEKIQAPYDLPTDVVPDFSDMTKTFGQKDIPKEPALLFFFASWCRPCLYELSNLADLSKRKDVLFYGIAVDDDKERLTKILVKIDNPFFKIGFDKKKVWARKMGANTLPTAFILDKNGQVNAKIKGIITKEFYLNTLLPYLQELYHE